MLSILRVEHRDIQLKILKAEGVQGNPKPTHASIPAGVASRKHSFVRTTCSATPRLGDLREEAERLAEAISCLEKLVGTAEPQSSPVRQIS